jgi:hypothetical protein
VLELGECGVELAGAGGDENVLGVLGGALQAIGVEQVERRDDGIQFASDDGIQFASDNGGK